MATSVGASPKATLRSATSQVVAAEVREAIHRDRTTRVARVVQPPPSRKRPVGAIVAGAVLGAGAGLFAGGFIGYKFDRGFHDCGCDDPGLMGVLYGAPIGALVGGILGGKFLFR